MDQKEFGTLWQEASAAFHDYMAAVNRTFALLADLETFPVSIDKRLEIVQQRQRETLAREKFHTAREALFSAVHGNTGKPTFETVKLTELPPIQSHKLK
jgi:hypothetical protein